MNENQNDCVTDAIGQEKNKTKASEKPLDLDHVVRDELGEFGWFQLRNILLVTIPIALSAFKNDYIFTAAAIPHRCRIPECGETGKLHPYDPSWILNAVPDTSSGISSCTRYAAKDSVMNGTLDSCPAKLFDHMTTVACEGFVYSKDTTVVYEFDLGCQQWLRALAGTMTNIGLFLGLPISGYISDRFGRRISVVYNIFGFGIMGVIRSFSVNYTMFLILQLGQTIMGASVFTSSFILAAELIGPKYRAWANVTLASTFSLGQMLLGGIAWLFNYWRHVTLISCVPCLFIIAYYWILSESFRWLLSKGKYVEARKVIETAARVNKKTISEKTIEMLMNPPQSPNSNLKNTKAGLVRTILRSPVLLKRVCTTPIWWIASTFVYYGLSINSTGLSSTMYLNYILTSAVEIPGFFCGILFLDRIGRKATISSGYFFSALCNLLFVFIPFDRPTIRLITYLLGKFGISMSMGSLYLYTSELYPTEYRQTLLAFSSMIGRLGSIVAPLTPVFTQYWHGLPSVMFAALGLVGGGLVLTQPETLGTKLPDTLAEAERLGKPDSKLNSLNTH